MAKSAWQKVKLSGFECLVPLDKESEDKLSNYKMHEPVTGDFKGTLNPRSLSQLGLYWKACSVFSENTDNPDYNTKEKVDWRIRNKLQFFNYDLTMVVEGRVTFEVRSISVNNLHHIEACKYFDNAFSLMASAWKMDADRFIEIVKSKMIGKL